MCLAVPGKIIKISGNDPLSRLGQIDFSGISKEISLAYLPEAKQDDYVIVHAGFAISLIDEEDAKESLNAFQQLDDFEANH
jgi:hydrogenase expression/formation protein HypC